LSDTRIEHSSCRFVAKSHEADKPVTTLQFLHTTVSVSNQAVLSSCLVGGLAFGQTKKMVDTLNENILRFQDDILRTFRVRGQVSKAPLITA
jgi:hypothetical protein